MRFGATEMFIVMAIAVGISGGIGYLIGRSKGYGALGFVLGLVFNLIGWIIVAVLPARERRPASR